MTWGIESNVIERFSSAGIKKENVTFVQDTYTFEFPDVPSKFVEVFKTCYGPTMNAFESAEKKGRADALQSELEDLFNSHNKSMNKDTTSIPANYLRVTVDVN